ncbi:MAG TPA: hypothetical protein DEO65_04420 [Bacillus bacterium]|uniref:hypothetical protein n=1 Tax=Siminovitchia fordii TaxID=254759 RepID=UPI00035F8368|nr:hypothetical protein [Siminovitchia fordii]HBZ09120.1 hypothetical protein [Bacillus sp. (in: firmicutes)]
MRDELREILVANVLTVKGEVWEPSAAGPELPKPHLVLREGVQNTGEPYADFTTFYEVWPYVKRTSFRRVDDLSQEVISALHRKRFDVKAVPHYIEYIGTASEDIVDKEWDALTRGLRFQVFSLAWLLHKAVEPDPVDGMKKWTERIFPNLQTNPVAWSPSDDTPALYWRQASLQGTEPTNWGAWITARLRGHIIAPEVAVRKEWTELVTRKLALDAKTYLSDNSKMRFLHVSADSGYDPFQQGQIQLDVRYGILKEKIPYEKINRVEADPAHGGVIIG